MKATDRNPIPRQARGALAWLGIRALAVGLCAAAAAALACGEAEVEAEIQHPPVVVVPVTVDDVRERIEATGELRAQEDAAIAAEIAGRVTAVLADEGEAVEAGQVLIELDPERRTLEVAAARARYEETTAAVAEQERDHERVKQLHTKGIASQARLDESATQLSLMKSRAAASRAQLGVAQRSFEDATVRAPFAGVLGRRHVSRGEFVGVGQPLFELVALDPIEVEFQLPERDSARVEEGQAVKILVAPYPDEHFEGMVSVISPTIEPRTRTLRVKALVVNDDGRLRPGLFARVDLGVALHRDVLLVPEEAILQRADGQVVFRTKDGDRVERVLVQTGRHHDGMVEVASGLEASDAVVTRGQAGLVDGVAVSPRNPDGTPVHTELSAAQQETRVR